MWSPDFFGDNHDDETSIFTHVLYDHYQPPDFVYSDDYMVGADPKLNFVFVAGQSNEQYWFKHFEAQISAFKTNQVLVLWGGDFAHTSNKTYDTLDKLFESLTEFRDKNPVLAQYEFTYSSMTAYFDAVDADAKSLEIEWSVESGDFWQYSHHSIPGSYWTGYFTSRPEIKREIRAYSDFVQASTALFGTSYALVS